MFWKQQGTGPWGNGGDQGSSGSNPWGGKSGGGGQPSPDLEDLIRQGQDKIKKFFPGGKGSFKGFILLLVALFVLWSASGSAASTYGPTISQLKSLENTKILRQNFNRQLLKINSKINNVNNYLEKNHATLIDLN